MTLIGKKICSSPGTLNFFSGSDCHTTRHCPGKTRALQELLHEAQKRIMQKLESQSDNV